jgi:hypothetical protein
VERLIKDFASVTLGNLNIMCNVKKTKEGMWNADEIQKDMSPSSFNYVTVFQATKLQALEKS